MKKLLIILPVLGLMALVFAGCKAEEGSGNVITRTLTLAGFERVSINGPGEVNLVQGGAESVVIQAEDNVMPLILASVEEGTLVIRYKKSGKKPLVRPTRPVLVTVTARKVSGLSVSGSALMRTQKLTADKLRLDIKGTGVLAIGELRADFLETYIKGSGSITVSGHVDQQSLVVAGSGEFRGGELYSKSAEASVGGSGAGILRVSDRLDVLIKGSGLLSYYGTPWINADIQGTGAVRSLNK